MNMRAITWLNNQGDTTITWTEPQDEAMLAIIRKKMEKGVAFFIINNRLTGNVLPEKLTDVERARKYRSVTIPDEDFMKFVESGKGDLIPTPKESVKTVKKAKTAEEVVTGESVAVSQRQGG